MLPRVLQSVCQRAVSRRSWKVWERVVAQVADVPMLQFIDVPGAHVKEESDETTTSSPQQRTVLKSVVASVQAQAQIVAKIIPGDEVSKRIMNTNFINGPPCQNVCHRAAENSTINSLASDVVLRGREEGGKGHQLAVGSDAWKKSTRCSSVWRSSTEEVGASGVAR